MADGEHEPLRYALVGSGMMGCEHLLNLRQIPGSEVVAIAEPHPTSREWARACWPEEVPFFDDHRSLLAAVDAGHLAVDAVVVATPNHTHAEVCADLVGRPLHVMLEKPMCHTADDARRLAAAAAEHPGAFWVALEYRYMPTVERFVEAVSRGAAGRLAMLFVREHRFPFLAKVGDWNRFSRNTGGTLVEKCCHFFDLMNVVAGAPPVRVYASGAQDVNHLDESYGGEVPDILDNAFVVVDFANGVRGCLDLCMFAEGSRHEQDLVATGATGKVETTVPGDVVWVRHRDGRVEELPAPMPAEVAYEGFHHGSSFREHLRFREAVLGRGPVEVGPSEGLWSVAVGAAAHRSIDEGRPVELAELGLG